MLEENLPTFLLKPSADKPKQNSIFYFSQHGSEFEPSYAIKHADPEKADSKNRYAAGLYDAFNPDVLFGEVLLIPEWTQPTVSAETIRNNGGVPPPPEPILPTEFTIQLYNPDQQVVVKQKLGHWGGSPSWEFDLPMQTFRQPSASQLDRTESDPTAIDITPKLGFKWKREGKISKDLQCYMFSKAVAPDGKQKKNKEGDITVALFRALKEVTLYESNFSRVEIEDIKGLEVVLLLSSVVIKDVYFGQMRETFNIAARNRSTSQSLSPSAQPAVLSSSPPSRPTIQIPGRKNSRVPPTDPRSQWELDAETARLQREAEAERKERERKDRAEQEQIKRMLEQEERETQKRKERDRRDRQAAIDRETEDIRRMYGQEDAAARPALPTRPVPSPYPRPNTQPAFSNQRPQSAYQANGPGYNYGYQAGPSQPQQFPTAWGAYNQQPVGGLNVPGPGQGQTLKPKTSFFGLRRGGDTDSSDGGRLNKKKSAVF